MVSLGHAPRYLGCDLLKLSYEHVMDLLRPRIGVKRASTCQPVVYATYNVGMTPAEQAAAYHADHPHATFRDAVDHANAHFKGE